MTIEKSEILVLAEFDLGSFTYQGRRFEARRALRFLILKISKKEESRYVIARNPLGLWRDRVQKLEDLESALQEAIYQLFAEAENSKSRDAVLDYFFYIK